VTLTETEFSKLTDFQRNTARYVLDRFHGSNPTSRFLVADEVGMGKTHVARGVIAGTIDNLHRPGSDVDRIDVLYICSNANIARQNISKLDVLGDGTRVISTRIALLATQLAELNKPRKDKRKIVNLIALTPGTSFQKGSSLGKVGERALLVYFTQRLWRGEQQLKTLKRLLRGDVGEDRWKSELNKIFNQTSPPDKAIGELYREQLRNSGVEARLRKLVDSARGKPLSVDLKATRNELVGQMRHLLARASVTALEPDLIILDEFQRFRHLLEDSTDGEESEIRELARELFEYKDAKVLLLSATPYKMFTLPEEQALSGDDHYRDFLSTVRFLAHPNGSETVEKLGGTLARFREQLIVGGDATADRDQAQSLLLSVMSRTERPSLDYSDLLKERVGEVDAPTASDLLAFVKMKRLAQHVGGQLSVDYWKSAPYFLSFMDGYELSRKVRSQAGDPEVRALVNAAPRVRRADVPAAKRKGKGLTRKGNRIEPGNTRLRALESEVIGADLHNLLWMPPSMPYYHSTGVFAKVSPVTATKRLIFSSWAAAPSSISALLSHEALRQLTPSAGAVTSQRLVYQANKAEGGRPERMSTLLLTVPQPGLAQLCDPLKLARQSPEITLDAAQILSELEPVLASMLGDSPAAVLGLSPDTWYWHAPLTWEGGIESYSGLLPVMKSANDRGSAVLGRHLKQADAAHEVTLGSHPADLAHWVAMVGLASPANCAFRGLQRVTAGHQEFTQETLVRAAATIAQGFRTLFNRPEVMSLIDREGHSDAVYWQRVLEYCFAGNLQAVLDEYLHHLVGSSKPASDNALLSLAHEIATIVGVGEGSVAAFDATKPEKPIRFNTRFALRYGNARGALAKDDGASERTADVQGSFNSPFWPFVLASTSVGQEGVDFHWWCHSLVHWNLPANVVDLEQREGRVHRFKGHAVRKNVAQEHRAEALKSDQQDPWVAAFEAAKQKRPPDMNELWPLWVYPGPASVECWVPCLPLSSEHDRERRLRRDRALYRLAFGQPRQDDLLAVLEARNVDPATLQDLRIDLQPPAEPSVAPTA
jgi:hypothetical protein